MGQYDFEEELCDSDADDYLQDEIRALSLACMPYVTSDVGGNPSTSSRGTNYGEFFEDDDDLDLVRSIKEQYGSEIDISGPLSMKPLTSLPPVSSDDDDDDFETLRAIKTRFSQYCGDDVGDAVESKNATCIDKPLQDDAIGTSMGSEYLDVHEDVGRDHCDPAENVETSSYSSSFPTSAQTFIEAIKKNRSCQRFIRKKMLHVEARMEEVKELQKRLKTLGDFQVQCKKKIGRALSQKQDARIQLISTQKQRANVKGSEKNVSAMIFGPLENSHVARYKTALENFPLSFQREKWSKGETQHLEKEIVKQFQESLFQRSADVLSALEEPGFANGLDDMISSITNLDITPEIIQEFSRKVDWNELASGPRFTRRSGTECEARWLNYENRLINRDIWTPDEDKHLLLLIQKNGIHNWSYIAEKLETNRTPFQCLVRYQRSLNASILKRDWTEEEDTKLRSAVESFGESNWQAVASVLEGRTGTQCSNRWKKTLLPARQKVGKWSISEDKRLRVAATLFGRKSWYRIAQFVPGRTQVQCRERWVNILDPFLNHGKWTEEDDMRLKEAIAEYGYCWSKVAACVCSRTDNQCRRRWKVLFPNEVPLLKAARDIKRAALISNFVDRESERPALGPSDFVHLPITDSTLAEEIENVPNARKKKSRKAHPTRELASCRDQKERGLRKRKKIDRSPESNNDCDDARNNIGNGSSNNKKRRASKSGSKKKKHTGNLNIATEPKNSCKSTKSHDDREIEAWDIPIGTSLRRPRGVRVKEIPLIRNLGGSQASDIHDIHDTEMSATTFVHCSNQNNGPEILHGQSTSSDSQLRIHEEETLELSSIHTLLGKKKSSKLQPRRPSAETILGEKNYVSMELRTSNDDNETHSVNITGSSKQKKSTLHIDQDIEWEDLPLASLFYGSVTRIQKRKSN